MASLEQLPQALLAAIDEVKQVGPSRTEELEVACWVELGALLDHYAAEAAASTETEQQQVAAPRLSAELLGLLPHEMPSSLGQSAKWPDGFSPLRMLELLDHASGSERVDPSYPTWRRGMRLSFALADVLVQIYGGDGSADGRGGRDGSAVDADPPQEGGLAKLLQEILEAPSTTDRLRLALRTMRHVRVGSV